jgi:hypothetical protein
MLRFVIYRVLSRLNDMYAPVGNTFIVMSQDTIKRIPITAANAIITHVHTCRKQHNFQTIQRRTKV